MKAALINSDNIVENVIVWDETCTAPEKTTPIILTDDIIVSPNWKWVSEKTFINPNPSPAPLPVTEPTPAEKLAQAGLSVEDLKTLLGL